MSIFVDETTKVVYQGLTGGQGSFYGIAATATYGTQVVAGTNPKKAGTDVDGIPVFANVGDAIAATGANASCIFIPAPGVRDAVIEAAEARHRVHRRASPRVCPRTTRRGSSTSCGATSRTRSCSGPTAPASSAPASANIGITAGHIAKAGGPVGIVSRSGTLTYQALYELQAEGHRRHHVRRHRR